jgi:large subunit ribosomal protein L30
MPSILVVNMRGTVNLNADQRKTLEQLRIDRRYSATIIPDESGYVGMLHRIKDKVAWCRADPETAAKLLKHRAIIDSSIEQSWKKSQNELNKLAAQMAQGTVKLKDVAGLKPWFRLHPPRGGFRRSLRRGYSQKGILGENPELPTLVDRMIPPPQAEVKA